MNIGKYMPYIITVFLIILIIVAMSFGFHIYHNLKHSKEDKSTKEHDHSAPPTIAKQLGNSKAVKAAFKKANQGITSPTFSKSHMKHHKFVPLSPLLLIGLGIANAYIP